MFHPHKPSVLFAAFAVSLTLSTAACSQIEELAGESDIDVDIDAPDFTTPDLNAPDFEIPDIVAPDIDVDIVEAPELPEIRFPDSVKIEVPEIESDDVVVEETPDETIYTIEGQVLFDVDQANVKPETLAVLDEILNAINNRDYGGAVEIAGHTDSTGTAQYNYDLSVRRATGVALWFRERLTDDRDVQAVGYGETQPIARNTLEDGSDDPAGQALNRRVEIIVSK